MKTRTPKPKRNTVAKEFDIREQVIRGIMILMFFSCAGECLGGWRKGSHFNGDNSPIYVVEGQTVQVPVRISCFQDNNYNPNSCGDTTTHNLAITSAELSPFSGINLAQFQSTSINQNVGAILTGNFTDISYTVVSQNASSYYGNRRGLLTLNGVKATGWVYTRPIFIIENSAWQVGVSVSSTKVYEGGTVQVQFFRTAHFTDNTDLPITLTFSLSGTAQNGVDYSIPASVTIPANQASATLTLSALLDSHNEGVETLTITLNNNGFGFVPGANSVSVNIHDQEVSITTLTPRAYEAGLLKGEFRIACTDVLSSPMTVNFTTGGTATIGAGADYTLAANGWAVTTSATIPAGTNAVIVQVSPVADSVIEPDESVIITLANGNYLVNGNNSKATVLITDRALVTVSGTATNASESGKTGLFTINRSGGDWAEALKIRFTVGGTAVNGVDYAFLSNVVTIPPGEAYAHVTVAPLFDAVIEGLETVVLSLVTNGYLLGTVTNATVHIEDYDDSTRKPPLAGGVLASTARFGRFLRGTDVYPGYHSFVIPIDFQQGVPLAALGGNGADLFPGIGWSTLYHLDALNSPNRITFQNPIVAFGNRAGGSPLYYGQRYNFGIYAGNPGFSGVNNFTNALRVQVYDQGNFSSVGTITIPIPDISNTNEWITFLTNGYTKTVEAFGLTTTVSFNNGYYPWPWHTVTSTGNSNINVGIHISHQARGDTNSYIYCVELAGGTDEGWMVVNELDQRAWSRLYTLEFEARPEWRNLLLTQPQFFGEPLPPGYAGRSKEEFLTNGLPVTNAVNLPNLPTTYTNLDVSPELRRHPVLDQFVADMGSNPILLANFVINEIDLSDAIDYNDNGTISEISLNDGGINRGALGVYLEGQGSPTEQCGLLIYLLRQAGVPAVYMFPPNGGLKMVDARLSKLLRMQIRGAVDYRGVPYTTNQIITVNYPWVAAYLTNESRWVHVFPWLKGTQIEEGLNLYDYMPPQYDNAFKIARAYALGDTNLLALSPEDDSPLSVFPRFIEKSLRENAPGISVDDIGYRAWNWRNYYARWDDFPTPTYVTNAVFAVESLGSSGITNVSSALTNIFNTVSVEISSVSNPALKVSSGELRMAEIHNRRLVAWHSTLSASTHQLNLSLAPYRTNLIGSRAFAAAKLNVPADTNILFGLTTNVTLFSTNNQLQATIVHRRYRSLPASYDPGYYWDSYLGLNSELSITNTRYLYKGDVAAFCTDVGRVTRAMLDQHAHEIWKLEQSGGTGTAESYQGSIAYLMGMSYYEKTSRLESWLTRLHKIQPIAHFQSGLAILHGSIGSGGAITLNQPALDMFYQQTVMVGNGTLRLDSGDDGYGPADRFYEIAIVGDSALEHWILNRFYKQSDSVSTARLLWLAQRNSNAIFLSRTNYLSEGEKFYPPGSSTKLKDASPSIWTSITNAFTALYVSNQAQAYITPGKIWNDTGSYYGVGALVIRPGVYGAYIDNGLNGGYSPPLPNTTLALNNIANINLQVDNDNNYSLSTTPFVASSLFTSSGISYFDVPEMVASINGLSTIFNPMQYDQLGLSALLANETSTSRQIQMQTMQDDGSLLKRLVGLGELIADPVNAVTGEFYHDEVDLRLNGPMPLEVRRNYSSHDIFDYDFGYGWKCSYMPYMVVSKDTTNLFVYSAEVDGSVLAYRRQTNAAGAYTNVWKASLQDNHRFQNISGPLENLLNTVITRTTNAGLFTYTLRAPDGSTRIYTEKTTFALSVAIDRKRPYLDTWQDSRGNYFKFFYGTNSYNADFGKVRRIESSNGNFLGFRYDVFGHIIEVYTGDGRRLEYEYDDYGDLIRVRRPDASEVTYQYQHGVQVTNSLRQAYSTHLIIREQKPDGRVLMNDYDTERRVINQYATVGPDLRLVRNASFTYSNNFVYAQVLTNKTTGVTLITDCFTNITRYEYTNSLITKIVDPLGGTTQQVWYQPGDNSPGAYTNSLKSVIDKRGLKTDYKYDFDGNVTNVTVTGDLTGAGNLAETAVTTYSYDTNRLLTNMVDAVNNRVAYTYTNPISPFLKTTEERYAADGTLVTLTLFEYYNVTNATVVNNFKGSLGLLRRSAVAYNSPDAATNLFSYNPHGWLTNQVQFTGTSDPAITNVFFYNMRGELVEQLDAAGRKTQFSYNAQGKLQWKESFDFSGSRASGEYSYYNENGEVTWYDGPRFGPEDYTWRDYDGAGRKTEEVRWRTRAKLDGAGVEAEVGDSLYSTSFFQYDPFGNLTKTIDPRGNYSRKFYDPVGQLTREEFFDPVGTLLATNGFRYNLAGDVTNSFNALGGITEQQYTSTGKPKFRRNPDGTTNSWRYYLDGRLSTNYLSNGKFWRYEYDDAKRLTRRTFSADASNKETTVTDRRGNVVLTTNVVGGVFTNFYDGLNRLKLAVGPATVSGVSTQQVTSYFYDASGSSVTVSNAMGAKTVTMYDALLRPSTVATYAPSGAMVSTNRTIYSADHHSITTIAGSGTGAITNTVFTDTFGKPVLSQSFPGGGFLNYVRNAYDSAGNLVLARDELNQITTSIYDGLNRVTTNTLPDGAVVTLRYNAAGAVTNRTMPGGLVWSSGYDSANRMLWEQRSRAGVTSITNGYTYYSSGPHVGLLHTITDGRGVVRATSYDDLLRPVVIDCDGPMPEHQMYLYFGYDRRGLVEFAEGVYWDNSASGISYRGYDAYGNLFGENVYLSDTFDIVSSLYQRFDAAGRRAALVLGPEVAAEGAGHATNTMFGYRADGLLASVSSGGQAYNFTYGDNGLLTSRSNPFRTVTVDQRDGRGRLKLQTTTVGANTPLAESLNWRANSTAENYVAVRSTFTDYQDYSYNSRGQLTNDLFKPSAAVTSASTSYSFDTDKLGVMMAATQTGGLTNRWQSGPLDSLLRLQTGTNIIGSLAVRASGISFGAASVEAWLDGAAVGVTYPLNSEGAWFADLNLIPGAHSLAATAHHPLGFFHPSATNTFTVLGTEVITQNYDAAGYVTNRLFADGRAQLLAWDALGRLVRVTETKSGGTNFIWTAVYDPFDRRIRTVHKPGGTNSPSVLTVNSWFDPQVEFLETAVEVNGVRTWKIHGPDLSGSYGGMQGAGGLEAAIREKDGATTGLLNDYFGHSLGTISGGDVRWKSTRVNGYGPMLGFEAPTLSTSVSEAEATIWRGQRIDPIGLYWLGKRYYDPATARFLSPDPLGHTASMDLYSAFNGDGINYFDADGRFGKQAIDYAYNGGVAGETLRGLAGLYNQVGGTTESTYLSWNAYNAGSLLNLAADAITPASYINAYNTGVDRAANVMAGELVDGSGWTWTTAQGVSSIVGDFVGYNNAYEAGFGVDRQNMTILDGVERTSRGFMAVSQMAGTTASLGAMYNPSARFFTQPVPPVAANSRWTQLEFDFVEGLNAQRQGYGPLPAGESPYQLTLFPDAVYDRVTFYGNSPTTAQRAAAAPYSFDHDPALVMHYWEGNGRGGLPGFNLTQTERLQQAQSLNGNFVPRSMQNYQGWQMMNYSAQRNAEFGLTKPSTTKK